MLDGQPLAAPMVAIFVVVVVVTASLAGLTLTPRSRSTSQVAAHQTHGGGI